MDSEEPIMRTYARKNTGRAEKEYDSLIGPRATTVVNSPYEGNENRKRHMALCEKNDRNNSRKPTEFRTRGAIQKEIILKPTAETYDPIFRSTGTSSKSSISRPKSPFLLEETYSHCDSKSSKQSKYDVMFKESEKLASKKFDALFTESEHSPRRARLERSRHTNDQSKVMDDLSSFNRWEGAYSVSSGNHSSPEKSTSPAKLPRITHASMVKIGGRLVLNIQRGGITNSLGGTLLLTPKKLPDLPSVPSIKADQDGLSEVEKIWPPDKSEIAKSLPTKANDVDCQQTARSMLHNKTPISSKKSFGPNKVSMASASYNSRPWISHTPDSQFSSNKSSGSVLSCPSYHSEEFPQDEFSMPTEDVKLKNSITLPKQIHAHSVKPVNHNVNQPKDCTVVKHVKNYQNCLEEGELQEFEDELEYLQEGIHSSQPNSVRCLSVTSLAQKCEQLNFRLYLRAHNILEQIFKNLQDADQNMALALATSSLLYMLSRDRQINIDKIALRILLNLVDPLGNQTKDRLQNKGKLPPKTKFSKLYGRRRRECFNPDQETESVTDKIKGMIDRCGDPLVTSEDLWAKVLASEALLRFTARRTSDWYREEIRLKGGLDHVISLVKDQVEIIDNSLDALNWEQWLLQTERPLCILERLLRVLENSIINSARNAMYLVTHQRALLLKKISILMSKCSAWLFHEDDCVVITAGSSAKSKATVLVKNVITQVIKLLVDISNDSEWSSTRIGDQEDLLSCILSNIILTPEYIDVDYRYEIMLLSLGLLVNLVESSSKNRMAIMQMKTPLPKTSKSIEYKDDASSVPVIDALVQLFIDREIAAKQNEILGEEGVKRAAEAKRKQQKSDSYRNQPRTIGLDADNEGYWSENEDGMVWIAFKPNEKNEKEDSSVTRESQSFTDPHIIESKLTPEQKAEMEHALVKANDHMEASIIASYVALVLGCLIHGNRLNANAIRSILPDNGELTPMITMLKKFMSFMNLTRGISNKGERKLIQVIEDLEDINLDKLQPPP